MQISKYQEQPQIVERRLSDLLPPILKLSRSLFDTHAKLLKSSPVHHKLLEVRERPESVVQEF